MRRRDVVHRIARNCLRLSPVTSLDWKVRLLVNGARTDGPELIEPAEVR
jgi:hypothetical protein